MKLRAALWRLLLAAAVSAVLLVVIANEIRQPVEATTRTYNAEFTDVSGLNDGADVRVRGVRVGKVQAIELKRSGDGRSVAAVRLTLDRRFSIVPTSRLAVRYQALTGLRYVDVQNAVEGDSVANRVTDVPTTMTQPSFDITVLFNGLQPVLATLSPDEINTFTDNAISFLQGDGSGLGPMLDSIHKLTAFVSDRQQVVATLVRNLSTVADGVNGRSQYLTQILDLFDTPINQVLSVMDEFRKSQVAGADFTRAVLHLLGAAGIRPGIDVNKAFDRAFTNVYDAVEAIKRTPVIWDNIPPPPRGRRTCTVLSRASPAPRGHGCTSQWPEGGVVQKMSPKRRENKISKRRISPVRSERFWGIAALVMITIVSVVVALLYAAPPNRQIVSFYTDDAASIRPGDTVRIAGIVIGTVKDLSMEPNQVRVRASVDRDAFVGDQSQVQVRMLTVVGGYYVTIVSLGRSPLGTRAIPKERVTMPYSLMQTLADTTKITEQVAPKPIRESIDQLQQGLRGPNVDSVAAVLNAGNSIADTLERQRGQLSKILELSDEYIDRLANYRDRLQDYIRKIAIVEQALILYGKSFGDAQAGIGAIVEAVRAGLTDLYYSHRADFLEKAQGILGDLRTIQSRNGAIVRLLGRIHDRMERALDRQNNFIRPELLATDICIPIHGSPC